MQNLNGKSADLFIQDNLCMVLVLAALHVFSHFLSLFFKGSVLMNSEILTWRVYYWCVPTRYQTGPFYFGFRKGGDRWAAQQQLVALIHNVPEDTVSFRAGFVLVGEEVLWCFRSLLNTPTPMHTHIPLTKLCLWPSSKTQDSAPTSFLY